MSLTLDLLWCLLVTKRAARLYTISNFPSKFLSVCGSQTVLAYSTKGRTNLVKYACCFKANDPRFRFFRWKLMVLLALAQISLMWLSHFKKVQVGNDQENAQSEKDSHSKNRGGKKLNIN